VRDQSDYIAKVNHTNGVIEASQGCFELSKYDDYVQIFGIHCDDLKLNFTAKHNITFLNGIEIHQKAIVGSAPNSFIFCEISLKKIS
jgi:hypothetical protein